MPKFKKGDRIYHPMYSREYSVDYVGKKEYRLSTETSTHIYLPFGIEGEFRLCDEQTVDLILQKYGTDSD